MRRSQVIQIALLLGAIFAAGVATGRLTAPSGPTYLRSADGRYMSSETRLQLMTKHLGLDSKQQEQFRDFIEDAAKEMAKYPPLSEERLKVFRDSIPKQRALLRQDQQQVFDNMVKQTERRFEQAMRRQRR